MLCSIAIVSQKFSSISQKLSPFQKHPSNVGVQLLWNGLQLERQELEPRNDTMYTEFCLFIHGVYVYTVHVRLSKTSLHLASGNQAKSRQVISCLKCYRPHIP